MTRKIKSFLQVFIAIVFMFGAFGTAPVLPVEAQTSTIVINELDADQVDTDAAEFVELYDGGVGDTSLNGLVVVFYNGSSDTSYAAYDLDGKATDSNGYFVLGNAGVLPTPGIIFAGNFLQNGQDAVALYSANATDFPNATPVTTTNLIDAIVYDTSDGDDAGLLVLLNADQPQVDENGGGSGTTHSNQRCPNGSGGQRNTSTYLQRTPTPGLVNNCPVVEPPEVCGDAFTRIHDIQGTGEASPLVSTVVSTEGVVTGDFQEGGGEGFFIQEPDADADPLTSEGIFIADIITAVNLGDWVRVRGTVIESYGNTEISSTTQVLVCNTGPSITPVELTLPVTAVTDFEKYEGMMVTFPQALIISEYFNFDQFGEIVLTSQRHMTPTALVEPGAPALAEALAYTLDRITLDDGRATSNPDPAIHPNGLTFDMSNLFRGGDTVQNVTGVMDYGYSLYRIQPTASATFTAMNTRPATPEIINGNLKIASFNVLNYFVTLDDGVNDICGPDGIQECRGADDAGEFDRQKAKILAALSAIDADIFGLMEIENEHSGGGDAVADLVTGLNAMPGVGPYAYIQTGAIGGDAIKQAILYKPSSVTPVGAYQLLTTAVDARFIDTRNRPALAQVFKDNMTGTQLAVAVNHLKSKGSDCVGDLGLPDDPDLGDGAGNCNLTRKAAAEALVDWLANPTYFPGVQKTLIIGDLNSYDKEDPIDMIKLGADDAAGTADDYKDMVFEKRGENAYGYVFDGQTGYLDHALANQQLAGDIVDVNFWHINADEPDLINYDTSYKADAQDALYTPDAYRSSDHDPVIVTLNLKAVLYLPIISK